MGWIGPTRALKKWLYQVSAMRNPQGEFLTRGQPIVIGMGGDEAVVHASTQVQVGDEWVYVAVELIRQGDGMMVAVLG